KQGWIAQNPLFHGYAGVIAYLPERELSIAVFSTKTEQGDPDVNSSEHLFRRITQILTPDHAID
ncbi:MAG TPA: D-alanyl-D-alanine carboxypeptidase, partial [Candidatus Competibacteraceae bacterium]|nr:D-alanyl-D-alanine carboxypeptidase [Candidatus Competibacteraceae bacterium]